MELNERDPESLRKALRAALAGILPGTAAHSAVLPPDHDRGLIPQGSPIAEASVLLALQTDPATARIVFPLIRRPAGDEPHAGQVALPGGGREEREDSIHCALREAREEIGLDASLVEVLGSLTPITIPVSGYRVEAVVGWVNRPPRYVRQKSEVLRILFAEPDALARRGPSSYVTRRIAGRSLRFPAFTVDGEKVWGATALILAEFFEVWRSIPHP